MVGEEVCDVNFHVIEAKDFGFDLLAVLHYLLWSFIGWCTIFIEMNLFVLVIRGRLKDGLEVVDVIESDLQMFQLLAVADVNAFGVVPAWSNIQIFQFSCLPKYLIQYLAELTVINIGIVVLFYLHLLDIGELVKHLHNYHFVRVLFLNLQLESTNDAFR